MNIPLIVIGASLIIYGIGREFRLWKRFMDLKRKE